MMPKLNRLSRQKDFEQLKKNSRFYTSPFFRLRYRKNRLPFNRVAVIVSTKISKKATARNRIRRQVIEIMRHLLPTIEPGHDILFIMGHNSLNVAKKDLHASIVSGLGKSYLLTKTK